MWLKGNNGTKQWAIIIVVVAAFFFYLLLKGNMFAAFTKNWPVIVMNPFSGC